MSDKPDFPETVYMWHDMDSRGNKFPMVNERPVRDLSDYSKVYGVYRLEKIIKVEWETIMHTVDVEERSNPE